MKFKQTDKILCVGRSGCGKSFLGKKLASVFPRLVIFDSLDEYPKSEHDIHSFNQFASYIKQISDQKIRKFKLIIKFDTSLDDCKELFDHYMHILYELGDVFTVIEEVQDYCSPYFIGRWFKKSMTSGRHRNMGFLFTTQRPSFLNKTVLSQSTNIFVGNLIDRNDSMTISQLLDSDKKEITSLNDREFLWFNPTLKPHTRKIKN